MTRKISMSGPKPRTPFLEIGDYKLPAIETREEQTSHRMSFNESPLRTSPKALEAFQRAAEQVFRYPESRSSTLTRAIAAHYSLDQERLICGNGSEAILYLAAVAYLEPGDEVIFPEHSYYLYREMADHMGASSIAVAETAGFVVDVDAILTAVTVRTKIVCVTNPGNPTGTALPADEMRRLHRELPDNILLVIDAAYADYMENDADYDDYFSLCDAPQGNVLITRTFSKIYGLAGLRVGWSYASPGVAKVLRYADGGYSVNAPAQQAALAALGDRKFVDEMRRYTEKWQQNFSRELSALGIKTIQGRGNFLLMQLRSLPQDMASMVNQLEDYDLPGMVRVTISTPENNQKLLEILRDYFASPVKR